MWERALPPHQGFQRPCTRTSSAVSYFRHQHYKSSASHAGEAFTYISKSAYIILRLWHLVFKYVAVLFLVAFGISCGTVGESVNLSDYFTTTGLPLLLSILYAGGGFHASNSSALLLGLWATPWTLFYSPLPHPSCHQKISCGGDSSIQRFRPSSAQYLMRGRVTYQEVYESDSSTLFVGLPTILQIFILLTGEFHLSRFTYRLY